ncbi:MAG TPA: GNAT family N-acetyltransferase [Ktedonobacteraceae bacterium]|nr:GNAT family N-acetyltransferase [Ktedonobacteraceae bacterium]
MSNDHIHQSQLAAVLATLRLPLGVSLRCWTETDFPAIQRLSTLQGWPTPESRPAEALAAWQHSWPTLVVAEGERIVGFVRGITDGTITTYIAELLVDPEYRGRGLGRLLLDACHALCPLTRLDLISTEEAVPFYKSYGFRNVGDGLRKSYR